LAPRRPQEHSRMARRALPDGRLERCNPPLLRPRHRQQYAERLQLPPSSRPSSRVRQTRWPAAAGQPLTRVDVLRHNRAATRAHAIEASEPVTGTPPEGVEPVRRVQHRRRHGHLRAAPPAPGRGVPQVPRRDRQGRPGRAGHTPGL
jgi:hypothetical protein